jgi:hypothetical protein
MTKYATYSNKMLEYSPETRSYDLFLNDETTICTRQPVVYCPWCGKKLPKDLGVEWAKMVEKELNIKSVWDIEWNEIPDKFKTDEWWKKRGL